MKHILFTFLILHSVYKYMMNLCFKHLTINIIATAILILSICEFVLADDVCRIYVDAPSQQVTNSILEKQISKKLAYRSDWILADQKQNADLVITNYNYRKIDRTQLQYVGSAIVMFGDELEAFFVNLPREMEISFEPFWTNHTVLRMTDDIDKEANSKIGYIRRLFNPTKRFANMLVKHLPACSDLRAAN